MHSSRMRTGRSLTVCWRLLPGGVCLPGGVWLVGCTCPGGWSRGVWSRGVWSWGVYLPGWACQSGVGLPGGRYLPGGVCLRHTPPVNRMTDRCKNITLATTSLRPVIIISLKHRVFPPSFTAVIQPLKLLDTHKHIFSMVALKPLMGLKVIDAWHAWHQVKLTSNLYRWWFSLFQWLMPL